MDRSFLSQPEVIAAARPFVCIRLTTYEDEQEAEFLKTLFLGKSGDLENTVFTLLAPDGQRQLVRPSRSARHTLADAARLAETLNRIAAEFEVKKTAGADVPELPKVARVRLALNVAASDNQPLAVLFAQDAGALRRFEERVRPLAWSDDFLGQLVYAATTAPEDLQRIEGVAAGGGLLVIQPDRYGLQGKVLAQAALDAPLSELARVLRAGISQHQAVEKTFDNHVREGHHGGIFWETPVPVTDPKEKRAREHGLHRPPPP